MFDFESVLLRVAAACFASAILAQSVQAASPAAGKRPSAGREAPAAPQPPAKASTRPGDKAAAEDEASASAAPAAAPGGKQGERWRYRYHQGRWWYWLPAERWVVWDGNEWEAYHPFVIVPESSATWNDHSSGTGLDWSGFEKLDLSDLMPDGTNSLKHRDHSSYAGTSAPISEPVSALDRARSMVLSPQAVLERSRWSLNVSSADQVLEDAFWPRSFYYYNSGYFIPGYHSPLYRYRFLPAPVGQFNYATGMGGYMGGALTPGMANGFLNRWP